MTIFGRVLRKEIIKRKMDLMDFRENPELIGAFEKITQTKKEIDLAMGYPEALCLFMCVKQTTKIKGDIAVVGVYKGGSAKLIADLVGNKNLYLFDIFDGHTNLVEEDYAHHYKGQFKVDVNEVKKVFENYKNLFIYKGLFPQETGNKIKDKTFSFVHLDANLYKSTKDSIEFFYNRMNTGGVILFDDYFYCVGVKKAVDEFFKDKLEPTLLINSNQAIISEL